MRILQANKFFYRRGGAEVVFFDTINGLRKRGHDVAEFSMESAQNVPSDYARYFAEPVAELLADKDWGSALKIFKRLFYSKDVEQKLKALILATEPEVAHLHNIYHHLSASTFLTLRKQKVPMVMTVHDVFPLCPNHSFLYQGQLREDLFKKKLYNCTRYRCIDGRFGPSLAGTLEAYYYRYRGVWEAISLFICPSQFMADKLVEYGFPGAKMRVLPNPFPLVTNPPVLGSSVVYLGRTYYEKGVRVFMEAVRELRDFPVIVAGSGPEDKWIEHYIRQYGLNQVERQQWVEGEAWQQVMARARVVVLPSIVYENCSLTVLEALSYGRIVVGVKLGGTPELIINGKTGWLAEAANPSDLARVIKQAMSMAPAEAERMTQAGRELVKANHDLDIYLEKLEGIYREVII